MTWLRVIISVVVGGVDDDLVDYVLGDVGTDVVVVGAHLWYLVVKMMTWLP